MKAWEQQPDESLASYTRFLVFRNLGPDRTVDGAFNFNQVQTAKNVKKSEIKISRWYNDSSLFHWRQRAAAWDIEKLNQAGEKLVLDHIEFVQQLLKAGLDALKGGTVKPESINQLLEIGNFVGAYITPETIERFRESAASRGRVDGPQSLPPGTYPNETDPK